MPKIIKKKAPKKKATKEDDVKSAAFQALDLMKGKQKEIIIGASVIVAIVIIFIIISFYSTSQYKKASLIQAQANNYYSGIADAKAPAEQRLKKAINLYRESIDIKATPVALFYLGNAYFRLGDFENAKKEYNRFINDFSDEELILPLVYQKLASAFFKTGENGKALEALQKLSSLSNGIFRDTALILEARYYDRSGNTDKAMTLYKEIVDNYETSPWATEAATKIASAVTGTNKGETGTDDKKTEPQAVKEPTDRKPAAGKK